jgi:hypothetical protein
VIQHCITTSNLLLLARVVKFYVRHSPRSNDSDSASFDVVAEPNSLDPQRPGDSSEDIQDRIEQSEHIANTVFTSP